MAHDFFPLAIVISIVVSIALIWAILKIPDLLSEQRKTNKLLAKIARANGVSEDEIIRVFDNR